LSLNRFAKRRDSAELGIVEALQGAGASVWRQDRPTDLLVGYRGRLIALEVKNPGAKPRKDQAVQRAIIESAQLDGLPFYFVSTPEGALAAIGATYRPSSH
jgi:hypothetical protein